MPVASRIRCLARSRTSAGMAAGARSWAKPASVSEISCACASAAGVLSTVRSITFMSDILGQRHQSTRRPATSSTERLVSELQLFSHALEL